MAVVDSLVRVYLLGGFRVWVGSHAIDDGAWRLRKAKSLVKLLALASGHRMHREAVLELLWPDLPPEAAVNNLHQTLHMARRAFAASSDDGALAILQLHEQVLSLEPPGGVWIDAEMFARSAALAQQASHVAAYEEAAELYGGELLPDDRYEEWTVEQREALRRQYLAVVVALGRFHDAAGNLTRAIEVLRHAVSMEPADEEARQNLMQIYARLGRRQEAIRQFRELQEVLRRDFEAEPDPRTARIYQEILTGRYQPDGEAISPLFPSPTLASGRRPVRERRARKAVQSNVPAPLTSFIGRERELETLRDLLAHTRLLTMTGPAGTGKTRLALELAARLDDHFTDGPWWIDLTPVTDDTLVPSAVASVLGLRVDPDRSHPEILALRLQGKPALIILDNCEHLLGSCASLVWTLLLACPSLKIVATSRQPLNLQGETDWKVGPLSLPSKNGVPLDRLEECEAIRLFMTRSKAANPASSLTPENAEAVAEICRRLDGLPLAIELAAGRTRHFTPEQILARFTDRFTLLVMPGMPTRHRSMRAAIDWSYALLTPTEQTLFNRLSVFAGGFDLDAAESVCSSGDIEPGEVLDALAGLIDKTLVEVEETPVGAVRYRLLETMREYALEKLRATGEFDEMRRQHGTYFMTEAEGTEPKLHGPDEVIWLNYLEKEHHNLRSALEWFLQSREAEPAMRLVCALAQFWFIRGHSNMWGGYLNRALSVPGRTSQAVRAKTLGTAAIFASFQGDFEEARRFGQAGLDLARETQEKAPMAYALHARGIASEWGDEAKQFFEESLVLANELGDDWLVSRLLNNLAGCALNRGDVLRAAHLYEKSLVMARKVGARGALAVILGNLAEIACDQGDFDRASTLLREALTLAREQTHRPWIASTLMGIAEVASAHREFERAARLYGAAERLAEITGVPTLAGSHDGSTADRHDRTMRSVRGAMGEGAFAEAWSSGLALSQAEAIEKALAPFGSEPAGPSSKESQKARA